MDINKNIYAKVCVFYYIHDSKNHETDFDLAEYSFTNILK